MAKGYRSPGPMGGGSMKNMMKQAQQMQQRAAQFLMGDPDEQADQIADARMSLKMQQAEQDIAQQEQEIEETVEG